MSEKPAKPPRVQAKPDVDWLLVEKQYRAGIMPLRDIAAPQGITEASIRKRAKRDGWIRNLSAKIHERAEDLVRKDRVRKLGSQSESGTQLTPAKEREVVEVNARAVADVDISNRKDLTGALGLCRGLAADLEMLRDPNLRASLEMIAESMDESGPTESGGYRRDQLNEVYRKIIAIEGQIKMVKDLASSLVPLITLERKVHKLDSESGSASDYEQLLQKVQSLV